MHFHGSGEVKACESHPAYAEGSCGPCGAREANEFELEAAGVDGIAMGRIRRVSEWKRRLEAIEAFEGRAGVMSFLS